ncbi:MAG: TonB family protein [Bacteroidales bacterium]|jgi:Ca-activated chloride channel family protein|nr:TonB family protein [Bacteroidales bacterium]
MKTIKINVVKVLVILIITSLTSILYAQEGTNQDKTLSPYFMVDSDNPEIDKLPLKSTKAKVNIAGVISDVSITQTYKNEGENTLEAIYVFPASTRAAIYSMKMTIGEREIIAVVQKKNKARENYEQAKAEGKTTSLLEQHRPNVFQMNVANILPGDIIKVEMSYTELLIPEDGVYKFVYPTVVGPRYSNSSSEKLNIENNWVSNPYTKEGVKPLYTFNISVNIDAGIPIAELRCSSHDVDINYNSEKSAQILLKNNNKFEGNRDYILEYKLRGNRIESGALLFEGKDENFFLAMIQPPENISARIIPPREYVFIVDVSGSMNGFPLSISKELLRNLIGKLSPGDKFNVLLFASSSRMLSEQSLPATSKNINKAINLINNQSGGGGTQLLPALKRALVLEGTEDYSRTFVIVTDGYVTVDKEAFELIRNNLSKANFFAFGIGSSVNRHLIEGLAHVGMGEPFIITQANKAKKEAAKFRKYISNPTLTNIKVKYSGINAYDIEPLNVPDVLAERPIIIFGKYKGKPSGDIYLTGNTGDRKYSKRIDLNKIKTNKKNIALKYLWARQKIRLLDDFSNLNNSLEHKEEITSLGLKYNLLTNYTSFIAIDSEIRNASGNITTVNQALPLPKGVSNYALGKGFTTSNKTMYSRKYKKESRLNVISGKANSNMEIKDETLSEATAPRTLENNLFYVVEKMPEFKGGNKAFKKFIMANMKYPYKSEKSNIERTVYIEFVINTDGSVTDMKIVRGISSEHDKEAIRLIKLTNKMWIPGEQKGNKVKVKKVLPIKFTLN